MKRVTLALLCSLIARSAFAGWANDFSSGPSGPPNYTDVTTDGTNLYLNDGNSNPRLWKMTTSAFTQSASDAEASGSPLGLCWYASSSKLVQTGQQGTGTASYYGYVSPMPGTWTKTSGSTSDGRIGACGDFAYNSSIMVAPTIETFTSPAAAKLKGWTSLGGSITTLDNASSGRSYLSYGSKGCKVSSSNYTAFWLRSDDNIDYKGYQNGSQLYAIATVAVATGTNITNHAVCWPTGGLAAIVPLNTGGNSKAIVVNGSGTATVSQALTGVFHTGAVSPDNTQLLIVKSDGTVYGSTGAANFADTGIGTPSMGGASAYLLVTLNSHVYILAGDGKAYRYTSAPVASFTGSTTSCAAPCTVSFTNATTTTAAPPVTTWAWTFGDAGTSSAQSPSHTYVTGGTFTVALTATNADGSNTQTRAGYITVTGGRKSNSVGPFNSMRSPWR